MAEGWRRHLDSNASSSAVIDNAKELFKGLSEDTQKALERHLIAKRGSIDIPSYIILWEATELMQNKFDNVLDVAWRNQQVMADIAGDSRFQTTDRQDRFNEAMGAGKEGQNIFSALERLMELNREESQLLAPEKYGVEGAQLFSHMPASPIQEGDALLNQVTEIFLERQKTFTGLSERYGDKLDANAQKDLNDLRILAEGAASIAKNLEPASEVDSPRR